MFDNTSIKPVTTLLTRRYVQPAIFLIIVFLTTISTHADSESFADSGSTPSPTVESTQSLANEQSASVDTTGNELPADSLQSDSLLAKLHRASIHASVSDSAEAPTTSPIDPGNWPMLELVFGIFGVIGVIFAIAVYFQSKSKLRTDSLTNVTNSFEQISTILPKLDTERVRSIAESFYNGDNSNISECVSLGLDATRAVSSRIIHSLERCIPSKAETFVIFGDARQGKTVLLSHLAYHMAGLRAFRSRKFVVLWCRKTSESPMRQALNTGMPGDIIAHLQEYAKYAAPRRFLFWRMPVLLFIDDAYVSGPLEGDIDFAAEQQFKVLREIAVAGFPCIVTMTNSGATSHNFDHGYTLLLEDDDAAAILNKFVEYGIVEPEFASKFIANSDRLKRHRRQLTAFMIMLYSEAADGPLQVTGFTREFDQRFQKLPTRPRDALRTAAVCQLVDVYLPQPILDQMIADFTSEERNALGTLLHRHKGPSGTDAYHLGASSLASWIVQTKLQIQTPVTFVKILSDLLRHIDELGPFTVDSQITLGLLTSRIAANRHRSTVDIDGLEVVRQFFNEHGNRLKSMVVATGNPESIVVWGRILQKSNCPTQALELFAEAQSRISIVEDKPAEQQVLAAFTLAIGFAGIGSRESLEMASQVFALIHKFLKKARCKPIFHNQIYHKYAETLEQLGWVEQALSLFSEVETDLGVSWDALSLLKLCDLHAKRGHMSEADCACAKAIEVARIQTSDKGLLFRALCHQAHFLIANFGYFARTEPQVSTLADRIRSILLEAEELPADPDSFNPGIVLAARAELAITLGELGPAAQFYLDCIDYYRSLNKLNPRAWNAFAAFICNRKGRLPGKTVTEWCKLCEELCDEVLKVSESSNHVDRTYLNICHVLATLLSRCVYQSNSAERPDYAQSLLWYLRAFESAEGDRDDQYKKTFQDIITHASMATTYSYMIAQERDDARRSEQLERIEFHYRMAYEGIPRKGLDSYPCIRHASSTRLQLARHLWRAKKDLPGALKLYNESYQFSRNYGLTGNDLAEVIHRYCKFLEDSGVEIPWNELLELMTLVNQVPGLYELDNGKKLSRRTMSIATAAISREQAIGSPELSKQYAHKLIESTMKILDSHPANDTVMSILSKWMVRLRDSQLLELCSEEECAELMRSLHLIWKKEPGSQVLLTSLFFLSDRFLSCYPGIIQIIDELAVSLTNFCKESKIAAETLCVVSQRHECYIGLSATSTLEVTN